VVSKREHHLALLGAIRVALQQPGTLRLTETERRYLSEVCELALADRPDPLGIRKTRGGQQDGSRLMAEALLVHQHVKAGAKVRDACKTVGAQTHRDGGEQGAVEKNYRKHRAALVAADRFYKARNEGRTPDADDIAIILTGGKAKGK